MWRFKFLLWRLEGLRNRIEWRLNQRLLGRPGYAACGYCQWAFRASELNFDGLCSSCDAWTEEEARREQEYAEARRDYERYLEEEERRIQEETNAAWAEEKRRVREEDERAWREVQNRPGWL